MCPYLTISGLGVISQYLNHFVYLHNCNVTLFCFLLFLPQVETWSGSIEVGITSLDPGNLEFPTSATGLCEGAWILSGSTVLHNGNVTPSPAPSNI